MSRASFVLGLLLAATPALAGRTIAVIPLEKAAGPPDYEGLGTAIAGMLVSDLSQAEGLTLVERTRLKTVLDELELGQTAFVDPRTAQRFGKGLGAELVVTGSYSVLGDTLLMDARAIAVETGEIRGAAHVEGPLEDFVAVEKQVVEELLASLDVSLSLGDRRRLLIQTPTEDAEAMARYGQGLEARDAGEETRAKKAFELALVEDPTFAWAASELAELAATAEAGLAVEKALVQDGRQASLEQGLRRLPPINQARAADRSPRTDMDASLRLWLLHASGDHCAFLDEATTLWRARSGEWAFWADDLVPRKQRKDPGAAWRLASERLQARATSLDLAGPDTWFGTDEYTLDRSLRLLGSGDALLLNHSMRPEKSLNIASALVACHPPAERVDAWAEIREDAARFGIIDHPLYVTFGQGGSAETVGDSMAMFEAWLRADAGADAEIQRITEAALARHPQGTPGRHPVLARIRQVVAVGAARERRAAARMGMSEETILGLARAIRDQEASVLDLEDPLCAGIVRIGARSSTSVLERFDKVDERRREDRLDQVAEVSAAVRLAGCTTGQAPLGLPAIQGVVTAALERPHPAKLEDERCLDRVGALRTRLKTPIDEMHPAAQPSHAYQLLDGLQGLWTSRCLLP